MKILIIQTKRIGDVIMTTPALRAIKNRYPDARVDFLTETLSQDILKYNPYIDNLIVIKPLKSYFNVILLAWKLKKHKYDMIIDMYCHPMTGLLSALTCCKKRVSFGHKKRIFYNININVPYEYHYSALHKLTLLKALDIEDTDDRLEVFISDDENKYAKKLLKDLGVGDNDIFITISPVSRRDYKRYPLEYFANIADQLIEKIDAKILFLYGPGEDHFVQELRTLMKHNPLKDIKIFSLAKQRAILGFAKLHIGNDNGVFHIAVAAHTRSIVIFAKSPSIAWVSANVSDQVIVFEHDLACRYNCTHPKCNHECVRLTTPDMVVESAIKMLAENKNKKTNKPKTNKPKTSKPRTSKPKTNKPKTSKPKTSKPKTSKPKTS